MSKRKGEQNPNEELERFQDWASEQERKRAQEEQAWREKPDAVSIENIADEGHRQAICDLIHNEPDIEGKLRVIRDYEEQEGEGARQSVLDAIEGENRVTRIALLREFEELYGELGNIERKRIIQGE